jgi:hypothetical protein
MDMDAVVKFFSGVVLFVLISLLGCANFLVPEAGTLAREEARIALEDSSLENAVWQTKDLALTYSISGTGGDLHFVGKLNFDRSLSDSYNVIKSFYLKMSFLDERGQVLNTVDITPLFSLYSLIPDNMTVDKTFAKPPGSSFIVFNYYGVFRGNQPVSGEVQTIFYFPFE